MKKTIMYLLFIAAIGTTMAQSYNDDFEHRASFLIDYIADRYPVASNGERPIGFNGKVSDFGKYNYPKIIAVLHKYGIHSERAVIMYERLRIFKGHPTFHFNLLGLPRILYTFGNADSIKKYEIDFLQRVFERSDAFNAWTCEGTENHVGMSRTAGYLYAQIALDKYPGVFPDAPLRLQQMKEWIAYTSKRILHAGTGEWNSSIYGAYNIIGWINVYDFASDPDVQAMAHAVLDYYATEMALHYSQAFIGGSDMRGKGNTGSFKGSAAFIGWLWFGGSPITDNDSLTIIFDNGGSEMLQAVHAALSNYRVPSIAMQIASKQLFCPAMYYNSKPSYWLDEASVVKQTFFADKHFTLGTAYTPFGGWGGIDVQIVSWKLAANTDGKSIQYVSGMGVESPEKKGMTDGSHRMPYDQLVHHQNVIIQMTKVPSYAGEQKKVIEHIYTQWKEQWQKDFSIRFPNDKEKKNPIHFLDIDVSVNRSSLFFHHIDTLICLLHKNILYVELDKVYLAIRSIRGDIPSIPNKTDKGNIYYTTVFADKDKLCGFIIEVADKEIAISLHDFAKKYSKKTLLKNKDIDNNFSIEYTSIQGDRIQVKYDDSGSWYEPVFDWGYGPHEAMVIQKSPPFMQPEWPQGKGQGRVAQWQVNGKKINTHEKWPVFSGPGIYVGDGILLLKDNSANCYSIDYTNHIPSFSTQCPTK